MELCATLAAVTILAMLSVRCIIMLFSKLGFFARPSKINLWALCAFGSIPFAIMAAVSLPFSAFCLIVWAVCASSAFIAQRRRAQRPWAVINTVALSLIVPHAIATAAVATITQMPLWATTFEATTRCSALVLALCASGVASYACAAILPAKQEGATFIDSLRSYTWFTWFSIIYVMFDALINDVHPVSPILLPFTLLSMVLLGFGFIAFLRTALHLGREACREQEYLRLTEERTKERKRMEGLIAKAYTDSLTGLSSRRSALDKLQSLLDAKDQFCVAFIDMNGLKAINDSAGHACGDTCLKRLATALRMGFPDNAVLCRIGGDEFLAIVESSTPLEVERFAERALRLLDEPDRDTPALSFCYGVLDSEGRSYKPSDVIRLSDQLMYRHKRRHRRATDSLLQESAVDAAFPQREDSLACDVEQHMASDKMQRGSGHG